MDTPGTTTTELSTPAKAGIALAGVALVGFVLYKVFSKPKTQVPAKGGTGGANKGTSAPTNTGGQTSTSPTQPVVQQQQTRPAATAPSQNSLNGTWKDQKGNTIHISDDGNTTTIIDHPQAPPTPITFTGANAITWAAGNVTGTVTPDFSQINWSNNSTWTKTSSSISADGGSMTAESFSANDGGSMTAESFSAAAKTTGGSKPKGWVYSCPGGIVGGQQVYYQSKTPCA